MTGQTFFPGETLTATEMNNLSADMLTIDGTATMTPGADLTLGADPTQPKQAATMEWVQGQIAGGGFIGATGGTIDGPLSINLTNAGSTGAPVSPLVLSFSPTSDRGSGGYTGMSAQVTGGTISQNPDGSGSRFNTEFGSVQLTVQSTAGTGSNGHSALGTHVTKQLPVLANGTAYTMGSTDTLPAVWSLYGTAVDISALPTSKSGPLACQEYDMQTGAIDDQGVRGGYTFNLDVHSSIPGGMSYATAAQGLYSFGLGNAWIWCGHRTAGNHIMSAHDCRAINGPETSISATSSGTIVSVYDAVRYSMGSNEFGIGIALPVATVAVETTQGSASATVQFAPGSLSAVTSQAGGQVIGTNIPVNTSLVSANNTTGVVVMSQAPTAPLTAGQMIEFCAFNPVTNVKIGANTYQVNYATVAAPTGTAGTLYLSSALQGTDGNAGNTVARPFYALIMRTGDRIGFDYGGNVQAFYDSSVFGGGGGIHLTSSVWTDGNIEATGTATAASFVTGGTGSIIVGSGNSIIYGAVQIVMPATFSDGFVCTGGTGQLPKYYGGSSPPSGQPVVPNPGSIGQGAFIWIANACKPGEASGSGTGVLAFVNSTASQWLRMGDYTTITY